MATGTTKTVVLAERIDVSTWADCIVLVNVFEASTTFGNNIVFHVVGDGFTQEEPGVQFRTSTSLHTATLTSSAVSLVTFGGTVRGEFIAILATVTKTNPGPMAATISLDLVMRAPME